MPTVLPSRSFGVADAAVGAHIERRVAEDARGKDRNADERRIPLRGKGDEFAERHLRNVPFAILDEAEEDFLDRQHETGEHDALRPRDAIHQVADMIVIGGGERQMQPRRAAALDEFRLALGACRPDSARFVDRHDRVRLPSVAPRRGAGRTLHQGRHPCMRKSDAFNSPAGQCQDRRAARGKCC